MFSKTVGDFSTALSKTKDMFAEWCVRYELRRRRHNERVEEIGRDYHDSAYAQAISRHFTLYCVLENAFGLPHDDVEKFEKRVYQALDKHLILDETEVSLTSPFVDSLSRHPDEDDCVRALCKKGLIREVP